MISLIFPKLIRSVARDGIGLFEFSRHPPASGSIRNDTRQASPAGGKLAKFSVQFPLLTVFAILCCPRPGNPAGPATEPG
jgi:hypothetical protein